MVPLAGSGQQAAGSDQESPLALVYGHAAQVNHLSPAADAAPTRDLGPLPACIGRPALLLPAA